MISQGASTHVLVSRLSSSRKQTNILLPLLQPALVNKVPGKQVINYQCAGEEPIAYHTLPLDNIWESKGQTICFCAS